MNDVEYLTARGIDYRGTLGKIKKQSKEPLQAIFEAITNSLEAIVIRERKYPNSGGGIVSVDIFMATLPLLPEGRLDGLVFDRLAIVDNGIGFEEAEFDRLISLHDEGKGFSNKGSGRVQFLHTFGETKVSSIYRDCTSLTGFKKRLFTLSKSEDFLNKNAFIRLDEGNEKDCKASHSCTAVSFESVLEDKSVFNKLSCDMLKEALIERYLKYFCEHRECLPRISIRLFADGEMKGDVVEIKDEDIPHVDKKMSFDVFYSTIRNESIEKSEKSEEFELTAFRISSKRLSKNEIKLVSKGEASKTISIMSIRPDDQINNHRYLFLLSGDYIDSRDRDTRGDINIVEESEFRKGRYDLFVDDEILLGEIENEADGEILKNYDEIRIEREKKSRNIEDLKSMFLLNPKTLRELSDKIGINDSDDKILKRVYQEDAKRMAKVDAEIRMQINDLKNMDTTRPSYAQELNTLASKLVRSIPLQNRTALAHYVARRKLVLEIFDKILNKKLETQKSGKRQFEEKLLHNLIFQQSSDNPEESDLWLINEDFIYFKGTSEMELGEISLNEKSIIKKSLSDEENEYRKKQRGDALRKRPDILLFPNEGKCIIIEFKSPGVNISDHLNQINRYASLINNLSRGEYNFTSYYGYLVGENIDSDDIIDNDSDFISACQFDFIFRPHKRIVGKFGRLDGALYTEIIKYSSLLRRALARNKVFVDKITSSGGYA